MNPALPRILCVDDDESLLAGLTRNLRRHYSVVTAVGGQQALDLLRRDRDFVVIVSDMRMPGMNGAEFFGQAQLLVPDAVRVLLTGQADMNTVVQAINDGRIFRYLSKPIEKEDLIRVVGSAIAQHQLQRASAEANDEARRGAIELASQLLLLVSTEKWAHAQRMRSLAAAIAGRLHLSDPIVVEAAVILSEVARLWPSDGSIFGAGIPSLEDARRVVQQLRHDRATASVAAQIVRAVTIYDNALVTNVAADVALAQVAGACDARIVEGLRAEVETIESPMMVAVGDLEVGMRLHSPLHRQDGTVVVPARVELTAFLMHRIEVEASGLELYAEVATRVGATCDVSIFDDQPEVADAADESGSEGEDDAVLAFVDGV